MGLGLGFIADDGKFCLVRGFELQQPAVHLVVIPGICPQVAFGDGRQSPLSFPAFPHDFLHLDLAQRLRVEALSQRNDQSFPFSSHELIMVKLDHPRGISRSFLSDEANAQLREHFLALLAQPNLLVEDKPSFLVGLDLLRDRMAGMLNGHPAGKLDPHLDCGKDEDEVKGFGLFVLGHWRKQVNV